MTSKSAAATSVLTIQQTEHILEKTLSHSVLNLTSRSWSLARTHKFKTIILLGLFYGTYKTVGFVKAFREMMGYGSTAGSDEATEPTFTDSQQALRSHLKANKNGVLHLKVF